ncbi:hypothetical protein QTP88_007016 [Uroleucon formosanum]
MVSVLKNLFVPPLARFYSNTCVYNNNATKKNPLNNRKRRSCRLSITGAVKYFSQGIIIVIIIMLVSWASSVQNPYRIFSEKNRQ